RYEEALQFYRQAQENVSQRMAAGFGVAEMLRALGRVDEAIGAYRSVQGDARFGVTARLREAELLIEKRDAILARQVLDFTHAKAIADKREKRLLRARLELLNGRPEKAIGLLDPLTKKPQGASHE